jgi:hypothetical protein
MLPRERVHQLIEDLPESELPAVEQFIKQRRDAADPFLRAVANAPEDDEPLSPEDEAAIEEGLDAIERGEVISQDELRRTLRL